MPNTYKIYGILVIIIRIVAIIGNMGTSKFYGQSIESQYPSEDSYFLITMHFAMPD